MSSRDIDNTTLEERISKAKAKAAETKNLRNIRAPDAATVALHQQAQTIGAHAGAAVTERIAKTTKTLVDPTTPRQVLFKAIEDPATRMRVEIELDQQERANKEKEAALVLDLVRERLSDHRCPHKRQDGKVCNKLIKPGHLACPTHWGQVMRVPMNIPSEARDEILNERKRLREETAMESKNSILDLVRKEGLKRPAPDSGSSRAAVPAPRPWPANTVTGLCDVCKKKTSVEDVQCAKCNVRVHTPCLETHKCPGK